MQNDNALKSRPFGGWESSGFKAEIVKAFTFSLKYGTISVKR